MLLRKVLSHTVAFLLNHRAGNRPVQLSQLLNQKTRTSGKMRAFMRKHILSRPTLQCLRAGEELDFGDAPEDQGWLKADCP